ncbi:MAG: ATP-binding protein [Ignavibacteria bacterium]
MKNKLIINPKLLVPITLTFGFILIAVTAFDIYTNYLDIYQTKTEEAASLLRSVQKAGENTYISSMEVESLISEKLLNNAFLISQMDENSGLTEKLLNKFSHINKIYHIYMFDASNKLEICNSNVKYSELNIFRHYSAEIDSIKSGRYDYYIAGATSDSLGGSEFLILHKRTNGTNGITALSVESSYLLEFRKKIGVGKLFQQIANEKDIEYIVIQDSEGIITASKGVDNLSSFESDKFLSDAALRQTISTRKILFEGKKIYEAVEPFHAGDEISGVIRIGVSLSSVNSLIKWTIIRSIVISALLLLVGIVVIIYIANSQSYSLLKNQYRRIQNYTGNILENMSDSVFAADSSGIINLFNKASENMFGVHTSKVLGMHYSALLGGHDNLIGLTLKNMQSLDYMEHQVILPDGRRIIAGGSSLLIHDENGNVEAVVAVARDVTAMRTFEESQKRHEKLNAMGELAAGVAHEIKNPLNLISITAQRLEKEFEPDADQDEYYQMIKNMRQEITRVTNIINQFLRFARPPELALSKINIREFLDNVAVSFHSATVNKNIKLSVSSSDAEIFADSSQLKQVMINLIQNAIDAVDEGGTIQVESFQNKQHLIIQVTDNGKGILHEHLKKIFDIYFTTKSNGNGLGLSIVNQIINAHNGTIKAESNKTTGTIFTIELPMI